MLLATVTEQLRETGLDSQGGEQDAKRNPNTDGRACVSRGAE